MSMRLTQRDYEILRTLLRVQFANTTGLQRAFFSSKHMARRRLKALRLEGLVVPHERGLSSGTPNGGRFWRLTPVGLRTVQRNFPNELIPENHIHRCARASLRNFEHRTAMADIYLALLESKNGTIEDKRERADGLCWLGEHEVRIDYQTVNGAAYRDRVLVPDSTLCTSSHTYFLEIDRSTETLGYCKSTLASYENAVHQRGYLERFADTRPVVLYVTTTEGRAKGLEKTIASFASLSYDAFAMPFDEATTWLSAAALSTSLPPAREPKASTTAALLRKMYDIYRGYGDLHVDAPDTLLATYEHLQGLAGGA